MPAPDITDSEITDGLVDGSWAGGSSLVLTYSVAGASSTWTYYDGVVHDEPDRPGYDVLNATQAAAFVTAMELWDSYVTASFVETDDETDPGAIRVAITSPDADEWGYAYLPFTGTDPDVPGYSGDIWISSEADGATSDFAIGGYDFSALLHEIGHALGLKHPFESPIIPVEFDNTRYTVMSYTQIADLYVADFESTGGGGMVRNFVLVNPITPMMFDIFAIQSLYGASSTTRSGNSTYTFDPDLAALQTIYDAGGTDTWDLTGHVRPSVIDLRPGSFSSIDFYSKTAQIEAAVAIFGEGFRTVITDQVNMATTFTWTDNVAIALNTTIENVKLGSGADSVIGNDAANRLEGNSGNDTLNGGLGADTLIGGSGVDSMIGGLGDDVFVITSAADILVEASGGGTDRVQSSVSVSLVANIENLTLTTGAVNGTGNSLANYIIGNAAANTLTGNGSNDTLDGGAGNDTLIGGTGNDTYYIDSLSDVLTENAASGTDTVISTLTYTLLTNFERLTLTGSSLINGFGNSVGNLITGNSKSNTLNGYAGNDTINGGSGNDTINAGSGLDTITGGSGSDFYVFNIAPSASNRDTITDYSLADTIRIENSVFTAVGGAGTLAASAFVIGAAAADAIDRIIYNSATGALLYDADGTGATAAIQFATLSAGLALTNAEFVVI